MADIQSFAFQYINATIIGALIIVLKNILYIISKKKYVVGKEANKALIDIFEACKKELGIRKNIKIL